MSLKHYIGQTFTINNASIYYSGIWVITGIWIDTSINSKENSCVEIVYKLLDEKPSISSIKRFENLYIMNMTMKNIEEGMGIAFTNESRLSLMIYSIKESLL